MPWYDTLLSPNQATLATIINTCLYVATSLCRFHIHISNLGALYATVWQLLYDGASNEAFSCSSLLCSSRTIFCCSLRIFRGGAQQQPKQAPLHKANAQASSPGARELLASFALVVQYSKRYRDGRCRRMTEQRSTRMMGLSP